MVVLLMLIPLLAPQEGAPQGAAGMTRIAKALGIAAIKVRDDRLVLLEVCQLRGCWALGVGCLSA